MAAKLKGNSLEIGKNPTLAWPPEQVLCPYMEDHPAWAGIDAGSAYTRAQNSIWLGGGYGAPTTPADGNYLSWYVWLAKGTYAFSLLLPQNTNAGICEFYLNATLISTQDFYGGLFVANALWTISSVTVPANGVYTFKMLINGKNASSSNYSMAPEWFGFLRTGA